MNYKNALVALAATLTLGVSPALTSVNASTNAKETTKTTKKSETKKATKKDTSKKSTKKTSKKSTMPKASSSYWIGTTRAITVTKNTKAFVDKTQTKDGKNYLSPTKKTVTLKKGDQAFIFRLQGSNNWTYLTVGKNNSYKYYTVSGTNASSTNWFKLTEQTNTNTSGSNSNSSSNKTLVTVKSNYQTAQTDKITADGFTDGYISPAYNAFTIGDVTFQPGQKYQVKLDSSTTDTSKPMNFQFNVNGKVYAATGASSSFVTPYNVVYIDNSSQNKASYISSTYSPDSSSAVVPKGFTPTDNFNWIQTDSTGKNVVHYYIYNKQANVWVQGSSSNGSFVPDYK